MTLTEQIITILDLSCQPPDSGIYPLSRQSIAGGDVRNVSDLLL